MLDSGITSSTAQQPHHLSFQGKTTVTALEQLLALIRSFERGASGIVYCLSRDETQQVSSQLSAAGVSASHYHAGMASSARRRVQQAWQRGASGGGFDVVCATIAMGMGIDKVGGASP